MSILTRRGFVVPQPHKRPRTAWKRFGLAHVEAEFEPQAYGALEDWERRHPGSEYEPVEPTALTATARRPHDHALGPEVRHIARWSALTRANNHNARQ